MNQRQFRQKTINDFRTLLNYEYIVLILLILLCLFISFGIYYSNINYRTIRYKSNHDIYSLSFSPSSSVQGVPESTYLLGNNIDKNNTIAVHIFRTINVSNCKVNSSENLIIYYTPINGTNYPTCTSDGSFFLQTNVKIKNIWYEIDIYSYNKSYPVDKLTAQTILKSFKIIYN